MPGKILILTLLSVVCVNNTIFSQEASYKEQSRSMISYPFSDPCPVAKPSSLIYPYYRFDEFSAKGKNRKWKTVELENDYIKVTMFPEIGGKIWGAVDKTSGKEFIYDNSVVKFRDIAMRGPWTSGGIEFNFGIIGHAPTSSTPIDYLVKRKVDGSVSCYVFSYEWLTRTVWTVEVNVPKDKAYFTTHTTWYNQSSIDQPYYQWMNAGYPIGKNAQFCYPGDAQISHGGKLFPFPVDKDGHNIGWYEHNNFGDSKSYHVLGYYNDYYGIYWHGEDFGSLHQADFDKKLGMKIFMWGQSREGGIWEDLLTDSDGQYIELQSGRMFNQPASGSAFTPYKHFSFAPQMTDEWTEYWFPVKGIQGVSKAGRIGALHVMRENGNLKLSFSPLETLSTEIKLFNRDKLIETIPLHTKVLTPVTLFALKAKSIPEGNLKVVIGDQLLVYSELHEDFDLKRPKELPKDFDWNSTYGLYTQGEQWLNQKIWDKAEIYLKRALQKDPYFSPALVRLASLYYREGMYSSALDLLNRALSLNTYQGEANYLYGLVNRSLGHVTEAKAAFSIATFSTQVRTAAYEQLGELYAVEKNWKKAEHYALKSLDFNTMNLKARQLLMLIYRKTGNIEKDKEQVETVLATLPLYHPARFEKLCLYGLPDVDQLNDFSSLIRNELSFETYIELAEWYEKVNCPEEAILLLSCVEQCPIALYQKAYLLYKQKKIGEAKALVEKANTLAPDFVFPFRPETINYLNWAISQSPDWKLNYYKGLVYWANQQKKKALACLDNCEGVTYVPFYLSRSLLKQGQEQLKDLLKAESLEESWRVGFALINHYYENKDWNNVVKIGQKYIKKYPSNYYIGLKYANGLCETAQYAQCISFLNKLLVLPNEGAYAGRAVYRSANLYQAMDRLMKHNYKSALRSLTSSKEWPENLGVGKPYEEMLDTRLEDFIEAEIYMGLKKEEKAKELYTRLISKGISENLFESANLLTVLALKKIGKKREADDIVTSWKQLFPQNKAAQWCSAIYKGEEDKATELLKCRYNQTDTTPWEMTYRDRNLELIIHLFK